jgi:protein O-mannosyl-transferase
LILILLLLSISLVYERARTFPFTSFDDTKYITENKHVLSGLSIDNIRWSFSRDSTESTGIYYHPLAWISHMTDVQLFKTDPGKHHLVNLSFHLFNTFLLFLTLWRITGARWKSLFVAAMFVLHPLNVESVVWVAERKNLLSTSFWLLTKPDILLLCKKSGLLMYFFCLFLFICGILSKPMLMTLPFLLLVLDYWPFERFKEDLKASISIERQTIKLFVEKVPFFIITLLIAYVSWVSLSYHYNLSELTIKPLDLRLEHAIVSYILYLIKLVLPLNLPIFHPYPVHVPLSQVILSLLFLCGFSIWALSVRKRSPFIITGWLWYLGTLVPALGLFQAGLWPAFGERWAYVPFIGIFIILAWGMPLIFNNLKVSQVFSAAIPIMLLIFWGSLSWIQTGYWKSDFILYSHALDVTENNYICHNNLGVNYHSMGLIDKAFAHYAEAVRINPRYIDAHNNLGKLYEMQGRYREALCHLMIVQQLQPSAAYSYVNIGNNYTHQGELKKAIDNYNYALKLDPTYAAAYNNLGIVYMQMNRVNESINTFKKALQLEPAYVEAYCNLGALFFKLRRYEEALQQYDTALKVDPNSRIAKDNRKLISAEINKKKS